MKTLALAFMAVGLASSGMAADRQSPDFWVNMPGGNKLNVNHYKGQITIVEFLLTTCSHCQNTSQEITKILAQYKGKRVAAIGCAIDDGANPEKFVKDFGLSFPVGSSERPPVYSYLQISMMQPMPMPHIVVLDDKGMIRAEYTGEVHLEGFKAIVDKLIAERAGAPKKAAAPLKKAS